MTWSCCGQGQTIVLLCVNQEELNEVIDVKDPDNTAPELRRRNRLDAETTIFCADHYM